MKKTALYFGLNYHKKTKSSDFFQKLIEEKYDVTYINIDDADFDRKIKKISNKNFDVVIFWQFFPTREILNSISYTKAAFFPMYDAILPLNHPDWYLVKDFNIFCFSKIIYDHLKKCGFSAHYFQYFPKPEKVENLGDSSSVFFWQRVRRININKVLRLFSKIKFNHIRIHKSLDPRQKFTNPPKKFSNKISYSHWFDNKEQMFEEIEKSTYYIAPRSLEGIGMSFLEAMAMGRVVVAPDLPTMNEYIKDGENGLLYDLKFTKPLKYKDPRTIQKNVIEYMQKGYEKWEKDKYEMLDLLDCDPVFDLEKICENYEDVQISKFYLFKFIPFLKSVKKGNTTKYILFNFITIFKTRFSFNKYSYYLFGFLPLLRISIRATK